MKIGIIGSGNIGGTLTKLFAQQGHEVAVANSRGPDTLGDLAAEAGERARAATVDDAAEFGELVVVAVPLRAYRALPADRLDGGEGLQHHAERHSGRRGASRRPA